MVWAAWAAVGRGVTRGAVGKAPLPPWSAWTTQEPTPVKLTRLAPLIEHTALDPAALEKVTGWVAWGAALKAPLPPWSAWTTQEPVALKVTKLAPLIEHTALDPAAIDKVTGRPEVAVAAGV